MTTAAALADPPPVRKGKHLFTKANASHFAALGRAESARRRLLRRNLLERYDELLRRLSRLESKLPNDAPVRLAATRAQLARVDDQILTELNAQSPDYAKLERMARTKALLIDQERVQRAGAGEQPPTTSSPPPAILPPPTPEPFPPDATRELA